MSDTSEEPPREAGHDISADSEEEEAYEADDGTNLPPISNNFASFSAEDETEMGKDISNLSIEPEAERIEALLLALAELKREVEDLNKRAAEAEERIEELERVVRMLCGEGEEEGDF